MHIQNLIAFIHKKEGNPAISYMDVPRWLYAKLNKPDKEKTNIVWFHLYEGPRTGKFIEKTGNRTAVTRSWGK